MRSTIKIYVSCHKPFYVPEHEFLFPVQVGSARAAVQFPRMLHDNVGENISAKNASYCELTAQYWAWKNERADYYGFFHYRRYLSFRQEPVNAQRPYRIYRYPDAKTLSCLCFQPEHMKRIIENCDVIVPLGEEMHLSVAKQYSQGKYQFKEDLQLVTAILREMHPDYSMSEREYLSGSINYFGNIFIMNKVQFFAYCEWLFPILIEFDRRRDTSDYGKQAARVDGYLAERLFGIYYTQLKKGGKCRCVEMPRVHFEKIAGTEGSYVVKKTINTMLPPGSIRRAFVKNLLKR